MGGGKFIKTLGLGTRRLGESSAWGDPCSFATEHTEDTEEEFQRKGAKDAKAGFARVKTFESRADWPRFAPLCVLASATAQSPLCPPCALW